MNQEYPQTVYENEEDRQLARTLRVSTLIWVTWGAYLAAAFTGLYYNDWKLIAVTLTGCALLIASWVLLRRGHLHASSLIVVLGALGTVTMFATVGQGIRDLALVAIPIVFIFAGLTLNRALFKLCVGLALAAVCWLALGEIYGWFVPIPFDGEMANWLYLISMIVILLVAALAVDLLAINMRKGLELARQEISQRKQVETNNRIIAEVQDTLLHPCELNDIYRLVSEKVKELIGDGITATSILDEKHRTVRMGSYHGVDIPFEKLLSVIGFDPWQKEFSLDDTTEGDLRIYRSGRLGILEGGLYALMTRLIPQPACVMIEKLLRVQKIYAMGFIHKEEHLGALVILARSDIAPHIAAIEQIVNLAIIAIERKRAEEEVKNSEKRFQAVIAHGRDEISLLSADGTLLWESPSVHSTLGYAPNQFMGENIFTLIHPDDQAWTRDMYAQVVQSPGSIQEGEFRLMHADGAWRWIECSAANLLDEQSVEAIVLNYRDVTERKRAEDALEQSEAKYRRMVETTNEGVIVFDADTRMTWVNQQAATMLGYTIEELLGQKLESLIFEEDLDNHRTQMQARAQGKNAVYERCFRRKDGGRLWTLISATATADAEGNFDGAFGMITDITERKRAEEKFVKAFQASPTIVTISRLSDGRLIDVNESFEQIMGYARAEALEHTVFELGIWVNLAERERLVPIFLANGRLRNEEVHFRNNRGEAITCMYSAELIELDGAKCALAVIEDITDRKQADAALLESEQRFKLSMDATNDGLWDWNIKTDWGYFSPSYYRMLGYEAVDFPAGGNSWNDLIHPEDRERALGVNTDCIEGRCEQFEVEYRMKAKNGEWHWILGRGKCVARGEQGRALRLIGTHMDITERKQAEEKIRAALEEKETLLREVHHRVKNNLQVIIALIKMRTRLTQDAGTLQFLTELENQAHTMALVYEQLYQSENLAQVGMAQYLRQLTANVLDTYGRRDAIQFHLDAPLALDVAQATPCGLIVNELFSNILKYAFPPDFKGKPTVSITLRQEDETYHLTVSDNGMGFPPGYDWRAAQTMGLRLVNLWVTHQLGGTLMVNEKPGTTFAITFDLKD